ncbi:carboxypeptidase-like regulatory domain-containing protein [Micromonospora endolithica]|nr:carboxypeptidase-like regulatory domain-containing protein [Micromonospora endolithica]TWJ25039.1 carboxypeptidase family protein [Micromonospora endolithica]
MRLPLIGRALTAGTVAAVLVLSGAGPAHAEETGTVGGRLTTSAGAGAAEVRVEVYPADGYEPAGSTTTDADGDYAVSGLAPGSYTVGFFAWGRPDQYHHHKSDLWDADPVTVTAGETTTVDEQLRATGTITGQIVDQAGAPVPGLFVRGSEIDTNDWAAGSTDDTGTFTMSALPGRYRLSFAPIEGSYQDQYLPGKLDEQDAGIYEVPADGTVTANDTVLPVGTLAGRLLTAAGAPLADAEVYVNTANMYGGTNATTDADGRFRVSVLQGSYKVGYSAGERQQWYRGKLDSEDADLVTVPGGQQTSIADRLLGTGTITVTAVDSVTGGPVANFCAVDSCSQGSGRVTVRDLPQGRHDVYLYAPDRRYFPRDLADVRVRAGQDTPITVKLRPGAVITTTIVDRQTGSPVRDVCVDAFLPKRASLRDGYGECSNGQGRLTVGPLATGSYKLFAVPQDGPYGRQWVGADGGTGDERQALTVTATAGQVTTGPQVRLDRAGVVTGRVTDATTGAPLADATVSVLTGHPGVGAGDAQTGQDGTYRLERLGPYAWPVVFTHGSDTAREWSGDEPSRFTATPVTVTVGGTATADAQLDAGVPVAGTIRTTDGTAFRGGYVMAHSADTGDYAGSGWVTDGRFSLRLKGPQRVFVSYDVTLADDQRYQGRYRATRPDGSTGLALFTVPATGELPVDLVIPTS